jgi:hypothetical protein
MHACSHGQEVFEARTLMTSVNRVNSLDGLYDKEDIQALRGVWKTRNTPELIGFLWRVLFCK